jgi:hypothetical protein
MLRGHAPLLGYYMKQGMTTKKGQRGKDNYFPKFKAKGHENHDDL